ncbi:hypothetical protein AQUCO_00200685v1 [Aquilegia coerulea]|uniref:SPX domain-containing protein n=1 Tax=Aquilegia coerulea TaxID=218851 RepID=A0A2G5F4A3_AQUCA|nr:hypothetical protein AQUCO_00200685v1 [Aquilegia coerulea]
MKFGKEFASQMVPEWQTAYMDYNYLKFLLKDIQVSNQRNKPNGLKRRSTLYRTFSGLIQRNSNNNSPRKSTSSPRKRNGGGDIEDQVILVNVKAKGSEGLYETMFLMSTEEGGEKELVFFRKLDDEFNKVNQFYKSKVDEVVKEATFLNKQMDALIAFRIKVENRGKRIDLSAEMNRLASDVAASAAAVSASAPSGARKSGKIHTDAINENTTTDGIVSKDSDDVLNHVTINSPNGTPYSAIKGLLKVDKDNELNFRKANLRTVEEQLKRAFIEFYQKLRLLKNYSFLNLLALSKIMKKYDKVSSRNASKPYLNMVDSSYIGNSDEVTRLVERVEATFIKHFSNSNRSKGMNVLRPKARKETHTTTFSLGFLTGCTIALIAALILIIHVRKILKTEGFGQYMENMFPLYSLFAFIVLHMFMYAGNLYFWRRYRVNYSFIFGFKQGTELGYREVFLIGTGLATLALASVLANLDMEINEETKDYQVITELLPLGLVALVLLITFCPFNIIYRSSRFFLLCCVFHCICAPLYKVTLPDFFLADQLTSQIQALRSLEFYVCYYAWGDFKQRRNMCRSNDVYNTFYFIVATIPYLSRLLQCLRRLWEERDPMQGYNGLKYLSTVVAVLMRTAYSRQRSTVWWILALVTSIIATVFSTYWDLIVDWGLLQRQSKNRWLRDKLILPHKSVYFGVMVSSNNKSIETVLQHNRI